MNDHDPRDDFERRVRDSLQRDGEQIRPRADGLGRIRERTAERPGGRRRWLVAGAIGFATAAVVVGAFFVSTDLLDRSSAPGPVATPTVQNPTGSTRPSPQPTPTATGGSTPPATQLTVPVYYLGETSGGLRLFREFHRVDSPDSGAVVALDEMLGSAPRDPDYSSPWAPGSRTLSVSVDAGEITVDFSPEVLDTDVPRETADLMLQQLVYTVQAALQDANSAVQVLVEGERVPDISGSPAAQPLTRADRLGVQAMTWVITPSQGATVPRTFDVTGVANANEGNVVWQLVQDGRAVRQGATTATEGMAFAEYAFMVTDVPAGDYTLRVFQTSAVDGSQEFVETKEIIVE